MSDRLFGFAPFTVMNEPRYKQQTFELPGHAEHTVPAWDLDGVVWHAAPPPARFHEHWAQSVGSFPELGGEVWRCPCGAIGGPLKPWALLDKRRVAPGWLKRLLVRLGVQEDPED